MLGDNADMSCRRGWPAPDISSVITHSVTQVPTTSGANPKSAPICRSSGPNPHRPGFERPHV